MTPPPAVPRSRNRAGFTLLELMIVIGIMTIMLVAIVPAMSSLSKSNGRKGAISNLGSIIEQTRSLALTDGRNAYVSFVAALPTNAPASMRQDYSYRAYAVFEDDATASQKIQVTKWQKLPTGISFRTVAEDPLANSNASGTCITATVNSTLADFPFPPLGNTATISCPYIAFDSIGTIIQPTTAGPMRLVIFEGFVSGGVEMPTARESDQQPVRDEVQVGRYNGRAKVVVR